MGRKNHRKKVYSKYIKGELRTTYANRLNSDGTIKPLEYAPLTTNMPKIKRHFRNKT